jgi:hypothetical protein
MGDPFDVNASIERIRRANQQAQQLQQNTQQTASSLMAAGQDYADQQDQERDTQIDANLDQAVGDIWGGQVAQAQAQPMPMTNPMAGLPSPAGMTEGAMTGMQAEHKGNKKKDNQWRAGLQAADNRQMDAVGQAAADIPISMPANTPDLDLGMTASGPRYDQAAGEAVARGAQTAMAADQARDFGSGRPGDRGDPNKVLPEDKAPAVPSGFSENSEAPLPGEETLPPGVAAWNDRRAKAGVRDGLETLRQVYESAFDRDPTLPDFATWVQRQGILPDMPVEEANARLDELVGQNLQEDRLRSAHGRAKQQDPNVPDFETWVRKNGPQAAALAGQEKTEPLAGKGWKDARQTHQELVEKRQAQQQQQLDHRGQQWVTDMGKRFAGEIGVGSLRAAYQNGLQEAISKGSKNPHLDAVRSANASVLDGIRSEKAQRIRLNVKQQADQYNRSRRMGLPQQVVIGLDGLANASSPDEKFRALAVLHTQAPMMGFDKMAAMIAKGQIDQQALGAWAQQMGGKPSFDSDFAQWNSQPLNETSYAGLMNMAHQQAGAGATPDQVADKARQIGLGRATQAVQGMMVPGAPMSPGDVTFVRQLSGDMSFDEFAQTYGLDTRNERARYVYEKVTSRPVGLRLEDAPAAIGQAATSAWNWARGLFDGPPASGQAKKPAAEADPFA